MPSHGGAHYTIDGVDSGSNIDLVAGSGIYIKADDDADTIEIGNTTDGVGVGGGGVTDHGALTGLLDDDHPQYSRTDGTRNITGDQHFEQDITISGSGVFTGDVRANVFYGDGSSLTGIGVATDHGSLVGLGDDDHPQYSLVDGTRSFTGTVGGVAPVAGADLTTKTYVDNLVNASGAILSDHGNLTGLADDDHTQYVLADGTRSMTKLEVTTSGIFGGDIRTDGTIFYNEANWTGGHVIQVPLDGDIQTYVDAAEAGDTLMLASGNYIITSTITVNKQLNIVGQGNAGFTTAPVTAGHGTLISSSTAAIVAFQLSHDNIRIAHLSINLTGAGSKGVNTANNLTGLVFTNIDIIVLCSGWAQGFTILGSNVVMRDLTFYVTSTDDGATGVWYLNDGSTTQDAIVDCWNVTGTTQGSLLFAWAFYCQNVDSAQTITLNLSNSVCRVPAGSAWDAAVVSTSVITNNSIINAYMCTFDGADYDAYQTGTNQLNIGGSVLANNSTFGTITYRAALAAGTGVFGGTTTVSGGGITDSGGALSVSNNTITDVLPPVLGTDAANKDYVDAVSTSGILNYVPYTGATSDVNLGSQDLLTAGSGVFGGNLYVGGSYYGDENLSVIGTVTAEQLTSSDDAFIASSLGIGTDSYLGTFRSATTTIDNNMYIDTYDDGGAAPGKQSILNLRRSDSDTLGVNDATQDGLALGMIKWWGNQGTRFGEAGQIRCLHDGGGGSETPSSIYLEASTNAAINTNQLVLDTDGNVGISTNDFDGTPPAGRLVIKGSTADGTTNILVGRDSNEVNVFSIDTDGNSVIAGSGIFAGDIHGANYYGNPLTLTGILGKREIFISAAALKGTTTAPAGDATNHLPESAESAVNKVNYDYMSFAASADTAAFFQVAMPKGWDEGTITFKFKWTATSGTATQTCIFGLKAISLSNDNPIDTAFGSEVTVTDSYIAASDVHCSAESADVTIGGTPAEDDIQFFQITRKGTSDTLTGAALLLGITIMYTRSSLGDD